LIFIVALYWTINSIPRRLSTCRYLTITNCIKNGSLFNNIDNFILPTNSNSVPFAKLRKAIIIITIRVVIVSIIIISYTISILFITFITIGIVISIFYIIIIFLFVLFVINL
jgi:hypothetical protein